MRKCIAGFLLCALVLQCSAGAIARDGRSPSLGYGSGISAAAAAEIARTWIANSLVLAVITRVTPLSTATVNDIPASKRAKPPITADMLRARVRSVKSIHADLGVRLQGPPMLGKPLSVKAASRFRAPTNSRPQPGALRNPSAVRQGAAKRAMTVNTNAVNPTGINHWWTYQEGAIPGIGKYMVNVGTGNLIVQSDDVDMPERGVDLAFRRTFNSMSGHDYAMTDGSQLPAQYGAGWTNNFDAHLATNNFCNGYGCGISVFDIDGARYDYTNNGTGCYTPPPGQYATLCVDGGGGDFWTKKNGTVYYFWRPDLATAGWPGMAAYAGRTYQIWGRNNNNYITFNYFWANGDATTADNLTQIIAQHEDGHALTLNFTMSGTQRLLANVLRSDGSGVSYTYDTDGNLSRIVELSNGPGNNNTQGFGWGAGHQIGWAAGPRWLTTGTDGGYVYFGYQGSNNAVYYVAQYGNFNPTPNDGTGQALFPGQPTNQQPNVEYYGFNGSVATLRDTEGHQTNWSYDGSGRVNLTQEFTDSIWLQTSNTWDANNNLTATTDARSNETDYAYDSNGNTIAVGAPAVNGYRPTSILTYDANNNVVASCDPWYVHSVSADWPIGGGAPSTAYCNAGNPGATRYVWTAVTGEPFGALTETYTPQSPSTGSSGYHTHIGYNPSAQSGLQMGLPTDVTGDAFTQADGTNRSPQQTFSYDGYGNLASYNKGNGTGSLAYDQFNRLTSATDPDNVSSYTCYYQNGQIQGTSTAYQYALDGGICGSHATMYTYDYNGNESTETHHFGDIAGTTVKWYDGGDRLVEVQQPLDTTTFPNSPTTHDFLPFAWMTRYNYDLSQNSPVNEDGASIYAHGNLYRTQEYLPSNPIQQLGSPGTSGIWMDVRGTSFDGLDRPLASYENSFGTTPKLSNTYDTNGNLGLLSQSQNALGQQTILSYAATGWVTQKQYQNDGGVTPSLTYTYDADGRPTSISSSRFGAESLSYDANGRLTSEADPTGGGYQSPATLTYGYYPDGNEQSLSISSSSVSATNAFQYSYRADGELQKQQLTWPMSGSFSWTYTPAGRELTQSDPYTGAVVPLHTQNGDTTSQTRTMQPKTFTYDGYGRVASLVLPEGYTHGSITYDTEGEMTGYVRTNANCATNLTVYACGGGTVSETYGNRGELVMDSDSGRAIAPTVRNQSADGVIAKDSFDIRSGEILQDKVGYSYDAAGRQTVIQTGAPPQGYTGTTSPITRAYDAENHMISQTVSGGVYWCAYGMQLGCDSSGGFSASYNASYGWGPNGHPIMLTGNYVGTNSDVTLAVHWDGDAVLFAAPNANGAPQYSVGDLAVSNAVGSLSIVDRDISGLEVATHGTGGFSAWSAAPPAKPTNTKLGGLRGVASSDPMNYTDSAATEYLGHGRPDGYSDMYGNTFQGVRVSDQNTGQWTSPDAYAGDVHDPMSQKPFVWNRNNPLEYSDASGYSAASAIAQTGARIAAPSLSSILSKAGALVPGLGVVLTVLTTQSAAGENQQQMDHARAMDASHNEAEEQVDEKETRKVDDSELTENGHDAHEIKQDILGAKSKEISKSDIRVNKKTGELVIFRKGAKTGINTGIQLKSEGH